MKIIIDALTVSFKYDAVVDLIDWLNIESIINMTQPRKSKWYHSGIYYPGLNIAWNYTDGSAQIIDPGITDTLLDLSGKGCRLIEQLNKDWNWFGFLDRFGDHLIDKSAHISRIDIACDCFAEDPLRYEQILKATEQEHYVCLSSDVRWISGTERCIYFGSPKSARMLRIYDKALEQGKDGIWIRLELQLRNDSAMSVYLTHRTCSDLTIGQIYVGMLRNYIRFVVVPRGQDIYQIKLQGNTARLNNKIWWDKFIGEAEALPQLYLPGEEYTLDRLDHYIKKQLSSSLKAYISADSRVDQRITMITGMLDTIMDAELNPKQRIMLDQLQRTRSDYYRRIIAALRSRV